MTTNKTELQVAIVGTCQVGKSTLMNCLLSDDIADMGEGLPTTHAVATYRFAKIPDEAVHLFPDGGDKPITMKVDKYRRLDSDEEPALDNLKRAEFHLDRDCLRGIEVLDTPGLDAPGREGVADTERTKEAMKTADAFVFVVPNRQLSPPEEELLREIAQSGKPFTVVMNCMLNSGRPDSDPDRNKKTVAAIDNQLLSRCITPLCVAGKASVWRCNALWHWCAQMKLAIQPPTCQHTSNKVEEAWENIEREFRKRKLPVPSPGELARASRVPELMRFVTGFDPVAGGASLQLRTLPNLIALDQAWQHGKSTVQKAIDAAI